MFSTGDAIVHPTRGVGVVVDIQEREWQGSNSQYYQIELLGREPSLQLMVPIQEADELGIRRAIQKCEVERVWRVLLSEPEDLPGNHKTRHALLTDRLHTGDVFQIAEVLRDLTWRQQVQDHLTTRGRRIHKEALTFLAGEIAAAEGIDVAEAVALITEKLKMILSP